MMYDALDIDEKKRKLFSLPIVIFDILISSFSNLSTLFEGLGQGKWAEQLEDAAEIARIVR